MLIEFNKIAEEVYVASKVEMTPEGLNANGSCFTEEELLDICSFFGNRKEAVTHFNYYSKLGILLLQTVTVSSSLLLSKEWQTNTSDVGLWKLENEQLIECDEKPYICSHELYGSTYLCWK